MADHGVTHRFEGEILRLEGYGLYPMEVFLDAFQRGLDDPACPDRVCVLSDSSRADVVRTPAEMRDVARFLGERSGRVVAVAVVVRRDIQFGLARIASAYSEGHGVTVEAFREEGPALAWLLNTGAEA